jgi:hypothetical protein
MDWKQIAGDFEADGSLRDIYVLGTTLVDWQNVIAGLYKFDPPPIFKINDVPTEIPLDIQEIFNMRSKRRMGERSATHRFWGLMLHQSTPPQHHSTP